MTNEIIQAKQEEMQVIIFNLGNEEYATLITDIQEIIVPQEYTRIPKSPKYVEGFINLRGNIIPVIDGRKKFSLSDESEKDDTIEKRIMVMDTEDGIIGLVVDKVSDVILLKAKDIEPSPLDLGENNEIFWGIGRYQDRLLILLNCQKALSLSDDKQLKDFQNITEIVKKVQS